jgi:hypothetical protein
MTEEKKDLYFCNVCMKKLSDEQYAESQGVFFVNNTIDGKNIQWHLPSVCLSCAKTISDFMVILMEDLEKGKPDGNNANFWIHG